MRQVRQLTHLEHHAKFLERPGQPFTFYGHDLAGPLTTMLSAGRQLQQVLKLADWIWGQFYAGDTLKASERGRLASKLLRHHRQASNLALCLLHCLHIACSFSFSVIIVVSEQDGDELDTSLSLSDFLTWYKVCATIHL